MLRYLHACDIRVIAKEKVKKILTEHQPPPLPPETQKKMRGIIKEVERQLVQRR